MSKVMIIKYVCNACKLPCTLTVRYKTRYPIKPPKHCPMKGCKGGNIKAIWEEKNPTKPDISFQGGGG